MKHLTFLLAFVACPAFAEIQNAPTYNGYICPTMVPDTGGEFHSLTADQRAQAEMLWAKGVARNADGSSVAISQEIIDGCNNHESLVNAVALVVNSGGFWNLKTPSGGDADGKWYPNGTPGRSMDPGDQVMNRFEAERAGIEIGN